jgi:hypothetical protein
MKKQSYLPMLFVAVIFNGCTKIVDATDPSPGPDRNWKIKVLEYKTNEPIYQAKFEVGDCTNGWGGGCGTYRTVGTWHSNATGDIFMKDSYIHGYYNMSTFSKENYWSKSNYDTIINTQAGDSGVVKLIPYSWLKIHFKNEKPIADNVSLLISFEVSQDSLMSEFPFYILLPVNNLDTTIISPAFGNVKNKMQASFDSAGVRRQVYSETLYLNKNDTISLEILVK